MVTTFPLAVAITAIDKLTGPLGRMGGKLGAFGAKATQAGKGLSLGLTAPIAGVGFAVLRSAAGFETSMLRVQALTDRSGESIGELRDLAQELGKTTQFSAGQAADAMGFLAMAGFETNEIVSALPGTLNLAAAAQMDLAQTADFASNILTGYGFEAQQLSAVNDVLTSTFTQSNTSLEQLAEAMKIAGPVASAMNIPFNETAAVMGSLGNAGFQASLAGTAVRGALAKLAKPSDEAVRTLSKLKIDRDQLIDSSGNVRGLISSIAVLEAKGASASDMLTIFGQRAGPGMLALVQQGAGAIQELQGNLEQPGITAEIAALQMSGLGGAMLKLKSAAEALAIAVGDSGLLEWATDAAKSFTEFTAELSESSPKLLRLGTIVLGVAAAIGPTLIAVGLMASGIGAVSGAVGFLMPALATLGTTLFTLASTGLAFVLAGVQTLATVLFTTVIPAVWAFTVALLANPIGLVVVGVVALIAAVVALWKNWDVVSQFFVDSWTWIKTKVGAVIDWLLEKVSSLSDLVPDWLADLFGGGAATVQVSSAASPASAAAIAGAAAISTQTNNSAAKVTVAFDDLPQGARVAVDPQSDADLDLELGFALGTSA
jgi:TP901 family phage tail tape measure protein